MHITGYRESSCLIELVVGSCALCLVIAYRAAGASQVSGVETGAWFALLWAVIQGARTWVTARRRRR
jgi:hypothetical protein